MEITRTHRHAQCTFKWTNKQTNKQIDRRTHARTSDKWNFNWASNESMTHNYIIVIQFEIIICDLEITPTLSHWKCTRNGQCALPFFSHLTGIIWNRLIYLFKRNQFSIQFFFFGFVRFHFRLLETLMNVDTNQFLNAYFVAGQQSS